MKRTLWTGTISAVLVALVAIPLLARAGKGGGAQAEPPESAAVEPRPSTAPAVGAEPGTDRPRPAVTAYAEEEGPDRGAEPPPAGADRGSLQAIGALAAANYFQTYLNIGFLADGKDRETYTAQDARRMLGSVLSLLDSVDRQLEALGKRPLDDDDRESLQQMRAISALLRQQGKALQACWDGGRAEDAARYESLRQASYGAIRKLMGIDP